MPDNSLPDEIISEILSPALKVDDIVFSDTSRVSPFSNYTESTSAYLVVCKAWLRVSTPLLYHVVILRSKAQAAALARTLSENRDLGRFIKKFRIEGGYGHPVHTILQCAPNVSDLWLTFEILSPDSTVGLCKGLHLINPTRLILRDVVYKRIKNKMAFQLVDAVAEAICKWDRLTVFDCPYSDSYGRAFGIVRSLVQAKRLHTIVIVDSLLAIHAYTMFSDCPLQTIQIKQPLNEWRISLLDNRPELHALLKYTKMDLHSKEDIAQESGPAGSLYITPSLNSCFTPMSVAPMVVRDAIWSRIIYFAMSVPERGAEPERKNFPRKLPLLLVSKDFYRLGLPHFYVHLDLTGNTMWHLSLVLSLQVPIETICGSGLTICLDTFEEMARSLGASLREFHLPVMDMRESGASAALFNNLVELRRLTWASQTTFVCNWSSDNSDLLLKVEELWIKHAHPSFLTVLSSMRLPSLWYLKASINIPFGAFLKTHGNHLSEFELPLTSALDLSIGILQLCPNLRRLTLNWDVSDEQAPSDAIFFRPSIKPAFCPEYIFLAFWLVKITFFVPLSHRSRKMDLASWERFLGFFTATATPSLREIQFTSVLWPINEREIARSIWVRAAERLLEHNIHLSDYEGKRWRPRLKLKGRSR
ncbi:hypothetical protein GGX14DRAFT_445037, partial [Mycena pura]